MLHPILNFSKIEQYSAELLRFDHLQCGRHSPRCNSLPNFNKIWQYVADLSTIQQISTSLLSEAIFARPCSQSGVDRATPNLGEHGAIIVAPEFV